ncbi:MAG: hypothetical protein Q7T01_04035 [bacterium]|nr:hypothetical protein [bacterium]
MRVMIMLAVLLGTGIAEAEKTTAAPASTSSATAAPQQKAAPRIEGQTFQTARQQYRVTLEKQLRLVDIVPARGECEEAKKIYRAAAAELTRITEELDIPVIEALGNEQRDYRWQLVAMKKAHERNISKAKLDALAAGKTIEAASARYEAIRSEIQRIEDADGDAERLTSAEASTRERASRTMSNRGNAANASSSDYTPSSTMSIPEKTQFLPAEFQRCFPGEISHAPNA